MRTCLVSASGTGSSTVFQLCFQRVLDLAWHPALRGILLQSTHCFSLQPPSDLVNEPLRVNARPLRPDGGADAKPFKEIVLVQRELEEVHQGAQRATGGVSWWFWQSDLMEGPRRPTLTRPKPDHLGRAS